MSYGIYNDQSRSNCHYTPTLDSLFIDHLISQKSQQAITIKGKQRKPISHIHINHSAFKNVQEKSTFSNLVHKSIENTTVNGRSISRDK